MEEPSDRQLTKNDILGRILFPSSEIQNRISELGKQITKDYKDKKLLLVSVLRGGVIFLADLAKQIDLPVSIDFMGISTYGIEEEGPNGPIWSTCCETGGTFAGFRAIT